MRTELEIEETISELQNDIQLSELRCKRGEITEQELFEVTALYNGYIQCFEYALGLSDVYGYVPDCL